MKIVFIAPFAFAPKATVSARMLPIATALVRRGHEVHILLPPYDAPSDSDKCWEHAGVRLENMRTMHFGVRRYLSFARQMAARARELAPDILHVFKPIGAGALAMQLLAAQFGERIVIDNDDWEGRGGWIDVNPYPAPFKIYFAWQERWALRRARAATCASELLVERTRSMRSAQGGPVTLFPNGPDERLRSVVAAAHSRRIELRRRFEWSDKHVAIYAGTIPFGHDMDILAQSLPAELHLSVHATGEGIPSFRTAIERAGKSAQTEWHGFMPHDELIEYLVAADIAVYPYRDTIINRAKCSGKVMDYMACGLPMVVSDVGMNRVYLEHERSALLTTPGDAQSFGAALTQLMSDADLRARLGAAAQSRIWEKFGWEERVDELLALYEQLR